MTPVDLRTLAEVDMKVVLAAAAVAVAETAAVEDARKLQWWMTVRRVVVRG
jgi:hypothetical protein